MTYNIRIYDKYNRFDKFDADEETKTSFVWRFQDDSLLTISFRDDFGNVVIYNKKAISKISIKENT
jgi:hypothetical protein